MNKYKQILLRKRNHFLHLILLILISNALFYLFLNWNPKVSIKKNTIVQEEAKDQSNNNNNDDGEGEDDDSE